MNAPTRVYACGGCGINLGLQIDTGDTFDIGYIDTSLSNKREGLDENRLYAIEGVDGSGKNRRENYGVIAKDIPKILAQFPPADFNIVLFSAGGGSGSTLGPLILKALLESECTALAVVVGADDSAITITNTINTLKSLESISVLVKQPVVVSYHENTPGVTRGAIDDEVIDVLEGLRVLTAQNNAEMDTQDLTNWLQFQKVSPVSPQLAFLTMTESRQEAAAVVEPVSVASLYDDPSMDNPFGAPYYNTVGFPRGGLPSQQLHFVINIADVEENLKRLLERQSVLNKQYRGYRQRKSVVDIDDNLTGDGLVL